MKKFNLVFAITVALSARAEELSPLDLHFHLESPKIAGRGETRIFVFNEETRKVTYVNLNEATPGEFVGRVNVGMKNPDVVSRYRIGEPGPGETKYFSYHYGFASENTVAIELAPQLVARGAIERTRVEGLQPESPRDVPTTEKITVDFRTSASISQLVVFNTRLNRATYVTMAPGPQGGSVGRFTFSNLLRDYFSHWRISVPGSKERKYFTFHAVPRGEKNLSVTLNPRLVTRADLADPARAVASDEPSVFENPVLTYEAAVAAFNAGDEGKALELFQSLAGENDARLRHYSRYYIGALLLKQRRIAEADVALTSLAEDASAPGDIRRNSLELLRQSGTLKNFEQRMSDRYGFGLNLDFLHYDSNIVTLPGSLAPVSDRGGLGFGVQAFGWYAPLKEEKQDLTLAYLFSVMGYPEEEFNNYALGSHIVTGKYARKTTWNGKPLRWSSTPGVGFIQAQVNGHRRLPPTNEILTTYFVQNQVTYIRSSQHWLEGKLNVKWDDSQVPRASEHDDASGPGLLGGVSSTHFLDEARSRALSYGVDAEWISSKGRNYQQLKPIVFTSYVHTLPWKVQAKGTLSYYVDFYYRSFTNRRDHQVKADALFTKSLTPALSVSQSFSANQNFSNVELGRYRRFVTTSSLGLVF